MKNAALILLLALFAPLCSVSFADTITLVDGKIVAGTVTTFDSNGFSIRLLNGSTQRIATNAVKSIVFGNGGSAKSKMIGSPATPASLIAKSKSLGLHEDMTWRKSRISNEWIAQLRCFNGAAGTKLTSKQVLATSGLSNTNNELNVQLLGASRRKLTSVQIEAEIYNSTYATDTFALGAATIRSLFPDCPDNIIAAFQAGRNVKSNQWEITRSNHNAGYDVKLVRTIGE